jgi:transketolase
MLSYIELQGIAAKIRLATFQAIAQAGGGHFGGSLSVIEILTALYFSALRIDPNNPQAHDRDRLVLSKGHGGPALYATLAEKGFFPKAWLSQLDTNGGRLPKHVDRLKVPGVDVSSGALGQGLSVAVGMALAAKLDSLDTRIYVVMGDGECNEGQIWEAAMAASKYALCNVTGIVDLNRAQVDGFSCDVMPLAPFAEKWQAFGWSVLTVDGHDIEQIVSAIEQAKKTIERPTVIMAHTIKGKGVSFMEGRYEWHSGPVTREQYKSAISDLEGVLTHD